MPRTTRLPEATREDQMARWGIEPDRVGPSPKGDSHQEAEDQGRARYHKIHRDMDPQVREMFVDGGVSIATVHGRNGGGLTAHRGVVHEAEHIDAARLAQMAAEHLRFSLEEIRSVFRRGRLTADRIELRDQIDARLLEVYEDGGNMVQLGKALGLYVDPQGHCRPILAALVRAKAAKVDPTPDPVQDPTEEPDVEVIWGPPVAS